MDGKGIAALAALMLLAVAVSATQLHCLFDEQLCDSWKDNKNASQGYYNELRFCCPPEPGQGMTIFGFPPDAEHCTCKAGTAEEYAHLIGRTTTKPADGGNAASGLTPHPVLAVILLSIVGVSLY